MSDAREEGFAHDGAGLMFKRRVGKKTILVAIMDSEACEGLLDEHQHVVIMKRDGIGTTRMSIMENYSVDRTKEAFGMSVDGIVTSCWWRN